MENTIKEKADKSISISETNKKWIYSLMTYNRETPNDVITRLRRDAQNKKIIEN